MTVLLDPTSERSPTIRQRLPRPERVDGLKIGILDIAKSRGDVFLHRLGVRLGESGIAVTHYAPPGAGPPRRRAQETRRRPPRSDPGATGKRRLTLLKFPELSAKGLAKAHNENAPEIRGRSVFVEIG